jgi:N-acetylmuramoyl-L-alanine amidase
MLSKKTFLIIGSICIIILLALTSLFYFRPSKTASPVNNETSDAIKTTIKPDSSVPKNGKIVCLDPGHGGNDVGAIYKNLHESTINL